mmetsp:Transcript_37424/g.81304  ORF Transcript_37424/g.81304 Transcript_37424/m.81304 type:complete len:238 (-) Transcript_37424:37-750(-)
MAWNTTPIVPRPMVSPLAHFRLLPETALGELIVWSKFVVIMNCSCAPSSKKNFCRHPLAPRWPNAGALVNDRSKMTSPSSPLSVWASSGSSLSFSHLSALYPFSSASCMKRSKRPPAAGSGGNGGAGEDSFRKARAAETALPAALLGSGVLGAKLRLGRPTKPPPPDGGLPPPISPGSGGMPGGTQGDTVRTVACFTGRPLAPPPPAATPPAIPTARGGKPGGLGGSIVADKDTGRW